MHPNTPHSTLWVYIFNLENFGEQNMDQALNHKIYQSKRLNNACQKEKKEG